jgi:hypothetical protein
MAKLNFNTEGVDTSDSRSALPAGSYTGVIETADVQPTKKGDGEMVVVKVKIDGPSHAGMVIFDRLLTQHPNAKAEQIGQKRLAQLIVAIGKTAVNDTDELIGKRVGLTVKVTESEQYGEGNDVTAYKIPSLVKGGDAPAAKAAPKAAAKASAEEDLPW